MLWLSGLAFLRVPPWRSELCPQGRTADLLESTAQFLVAQRTCPCHRRQLHPPFRERKAARPPAPESPLCLLLSADWWGVLPGFAIVGGASAGRHLSKPPRGARGGFAIARLPRW